MSEEVRKIHVHLRLLTSLWRLMNVLLAKFRLAIRKGFRDICQALGCIEADINMLIKVRGAG